MCIRDRYYLDIENMRIHLGGLTNGGYVPDAGTENIQVSYTGIHAAFEVYTFDPDPAQNLDLQPTNISHIVLSFEIVDELSICKVQRTTNTSKGWFNEMIISPCQPSYYEYIELNPDPDKNYYYRVYSEDEFGHFSYSTEEVLFMDDVVKLYGTTGNKENTQFGMKEILPITLAISLV